MSILLLLPSMAMAEVIINEVLYNPDGADGGHEWVELYNNGSEDVDISGWEIEAGTSSFGSKGIIPSNVMLAAGEYFLIGEAEVQIDIGITPDLVTSLGMGNASSSIDGLRLVNGSTVIDTVLYGDTTTIGEWEDDNGANPTSFAPEAGSGETIARLPNGVDTNLSGDDFQLVAGGTPKAQNTNGSSTTACERAVFSGVVINEVLYNPSGSDSGHEWIEIVNVTGDDVDLSGWSIEAGTSSFLNKGTIPDGTILSSGGYFLVGEDEAYLELGADPDLIASLGMGNGGSSVDGLRLVDCNSVTIDTVLYGDSGTIGEWEDDNGAMPDSFAPEAGDGEAIGRMPNGADTDQSGSDFQILGFPTPWSANDTIPTCDGQYSVKINEFLANPHTVLDDGTEISDDEGREWVELYNTSSSPIDLAGWKLQWGGNPSYGSGDVVLPLGTTIAANGYILVGGEYVENADVMTPLSNDFDMTLASSNADGLRLLHCGPGVADTVIYGPTSDGVANNSDELLNDAGQIATSIAPKPTEGTSIARLSDGVDSDQSGLDFTLSSVNTPGAPNPVVICGDGDFAIKINEIFPDPNGSDSGQEWIELYNAGTETIRLDAWKIETASSSWNEKVSIPAETELAPGEFYVIGEKDVPVEFADLTIDSTLSLGNASTGFDGVRLISCLGGIEDTLLYGKAGSEPSPEEDEFIDDAGNQSSVIFPESGNSIGRFPDGVDSDDNSEDFHTNMSATPRSANEVDDKTNGPDDPPSKGCRKNSEPPSGDAEPSKCSYVGSLPAMMWFASLVVMWRRQE